MQIEPRVKKYKQTGLDRGLTLEEILSVFKSGGTLMMLLKFRERKGAEMIPAAEVNTRIPQMVIRFYEQHLWMMVAGNLYKKIFVRRG